MLTDESIAQDLADTGGISKVEHEVWRLICGHDVLKDSDGRPEKGFAMCRKYNACARTLWRWYKRVRIAIVVRRADIESGRVRFGHSLASGSKVRWSADTTANGDTGRSSWNQERIESAMAGTQRTQGKLPVKVAAASKGRRKVRPAA